MTKPKEAGRGRRQLLQAKKEEKNLREMILKI